jgi:hypothetical protein
LIDALVAERSLDALDVPSFDARREQRPDGVCPIRARSPAHEAQIPCASPLLNLRRNSHVD